MCNVSVNSLTSEQSVNPETQIRVVPFTFTTAALLKLFFFCGVFQFSVIIKQRC